MQSKNSQNKTNSLFCTDCGTKLIIEKYSLQHSDWTPRYNIENGKPFFEIKYKCPFKKWCNKHICVIKRFLSLDEYKEALEELNKKYV